MVTAVVLWLVQHIFFLIFKIYFQDAAAQQREQLMAQNKELRRKILDLK